MPDTSAAPSPRPIVANIPAYVPGRPPVPRADLTVFKLSSNENPYPPLPGVLAAAVTTAERMNRYPDMGNTALYEALGGHLGVPVEDLAAGTGSVALIYHLLAAFCEVGDEVVFAWRSFEAYPIAVTATGAAAVPVPLTDDWRHDLPAMAAAITERTRVVLLCTPNNPTGPALGQAEVEAFLAAVPPQVVVVLDEAYLEFVRRPDAVDALATYRAHPNVVVLRTFSKAYGLAGLRVGYAVAPRPIAAAIRAMATPFGVSAIAQAAAVASLAAHDALMERVEALVGERDRVVAGLAAAGWSVPPAEGNFVWFGLGERAAAFAGACEEAGIVVRPYLAGDPRDGVRVTIGEPEANSRLLQLLATSRIF